MKQRRACFVIGVTLFTTLTVFAHDTWLAARTSHVAPGTKVRLDLTSGMSFPALETSIKSDRIDVARVRLNGNIEEISNWTSARNSLALFATLNAAGTATCWVELKPRQLELSPELVQEYFAEIDASEAIRQTWLNMKPPKRWREVYVKHAKTFIGVGSSGDDRSWSEPVGVSLEIVPEKDPTKLRAGDDFPVRVLKDGVALPQFTLGIVFAGNPRGEFRTTNTEGRAVFKLKRAGKVLLRGTELRRSAKPDVEWESDFTTLTIWVR